MKTSIYNGFSIAMLVITRWYIKLFNYISQYPNKNPHDMVKNPWCLNTRCCGIGRCLAAELQPTAFGRQFHGQSCWWMRNRKKKIVEDLMVFICFHLSMCTSAGWWFQTWFFFPSHLGWSSPWIYTRFSGFETSHQSSIPEFVGKICRTPRRWITGFLWFPSTFY